VHIPKIPHDGAYLGSQGELDTFHFAVISDTHTHRTADPAAQSETMHCIIDELNLLRPDFVLHAGDLIRGYTDDEARLKLEHAGVQEALSRLEAPLYPAIGNHDVREEVSARVWREFWGGRWYSFDYADCHFVMLDAELSKDNESVSGEQLEWLRKDLAEHGTRKRVFVTLHRPWWYDYPLHLGEWKQPGGRNDWNDQVDPILREYDLTAVFCGHRHLFEVDYRNDVPHIVAGGAGGDVKITPDQGGMSHYIWASVRPGEFSWSVIVPGQILGPDSAVEHERVVADRPIAVSTVDFAAHMPWALHESAARSGWHHVRDNGKQRSALRRLLDRVRTMFRVD
jgi:3',5'-cyclic AMP phosphodiesterase CpdA